MKAFRTLGATALFTALGALAWGQTWVTAVVENGDTIPYIKLQGVDIYGRLSESERYRIIRENHRLLYNIQKVMPYAQACAAKITEINNHMATLSTVREKEKYLNYAEKELKKEYEDDLRKMSFTQGKLLIKLIDRQCGANSYELIKLYKSSRSAFFWNGIAGIFGMDLREGYNAKEEQEIEVILDYLGYI
ncbi:MAG: DUF4294 domain-containing protein [Bacteroidetes bacterium]|jgi:hypothetical protein|nr:DUF4294 domain-containing protein [Bacteroidota bacterium]